MWTTLAVAQDAPTSAQSPTDPQNDIIVTARRRDETLQDVPIALSAYSAEKLETRGAIDITDLAATTPNTTLESSRGTNSTLTAFIRGIGQQDPLPGFEQGVGLYIDDVYLSRPQAALLDIYDVERIEVLRGPQGTLYGRNTIGGAIKYVTRKLSDKPELKLRANVGTYDQVDVVATASAPITDAVRIGLSGARLSNRGFGTNVTTGKDNYNRDLWAGRGTVEIGSGPDFFLRLSGDYTRDNSNARGGHRLIAGLTTGAPVLANAYDTAGGLIYPQRVEAGGLSLRGEIGLADGLKLRSITAWRKDKTVSPNDVDALPTVDLDTPTILRNRQLTQEVQLVLERGKLNGLIGVFYLDSTAVWDSDIRLYSTAAGLASYSHAAIDTNATAIFADFSYDISSQFSISAGGRYTWDNRKGNLFRQLYTGGDSPMFGTGTPLGNPVTNFTGERQFNKFTPRVSVSFKPSKHHTFYASYSQGFKGGGFDPRATATNAPDLNGDGKVDNAEIARFVSFEPETLDSYEIGYKGSPLAGVDLNLALFQSDYSNVQIPGIAPCLVSGVATTCGITNNAGKARYRGVEAELNAVLGRDLAAGGDRLSFNGTLGYIDARFLQYISNIGGVATDVTNYRRVQNTPAWTLSGTLDYSVPVAAGRLNLNTVLAWRSYTYHQEVPTPLIDQPAYALLDANITWRSENGRYSIGVHGKNLIDSRYIVAGYNVLRADPLTGALLTNPVTGKYISGSGIDGTLTAFYGAPRQVFVSFGLNF